MRVCHCKKCGKIGHFAKTCKSAASDLSDLESEEPGTGRSLKEIGREIIEQENIVVPRQPDVVGTIPQKGLWVVNLSRKRIAGKISQVKRDGTVLYFNAWGAAIEGNPKTIHEAGYQFVELEATHLMFEVNK